MEAEWIRNEGETGVKQNASKRRVELELKDHYGYCPKQRRGQYIGRQKYLALAKR
jgi:hypothetical protein